MARVVLLGASNLRLGLPLIVRHAQRVFDGPLELLVAHGFGRSYGRWSSVPGRALPGILQCQLWDDLSRRPSLPTFAMLTDVGNDLLYGFTSEQLLAWVSRCVARLSEYDARLVFTELPISSLQTVGELRYQVFRRIFFPPSKLQLQDALSHAANTNRGLQQLALSTSSPLISMPKAWYGVDPIHIRRRFRNVAWQAVVDAWSVAAASPQAGRLSVKNRLSLEFGSPAERRLLGRRTTCRQPSIVWDDGTTVSLY